MKILKIRSKRATPTSERRYIGVYIPKQVSSYLFLYSLTNEIPKSVIVRDILIEWFQGKQKWKSVEELIHDTVDVIQHLWDVEKTKPNVTFSSFKRDVKDDLKSKGIDEDHIVKIFSLLGPQ